MTSIEEKYNCDFGDRHYEEAVHELWEKHCAGHLRHWPPTLEEVKAKCKQIADEKAYDDRR